MPQSYSLIEKSKRTFQDVKLHKQFYLSDKEKKYCVTLARKSIKYFLENNSKLKIDPKKDKVPKKLISRKACFVTLMINKQLRGCIGHLQTVQELYLDIIENAVNAAFNDPRFPALDESELKKIKIEVSVLTDPVELKFEGPNDLLAKIKQGVDGLIIRRGYYSATFLPSVWEEIKTKEEFLTELCIKAGMASDAWKMPGLKVQTYSAIKAKE
ncbi:MAG: AmmeMemoRadiSam system protein A [archaeon]